MPETERLSGLSVLVLEDDYLLADDTRQALEAAGAQVIGPCRTASQAIALADDHKPNCAVVDINLGGGPNFAPAMDLLARGVRVLFMTGYDGAVIPSDLREHPCLQKPISSNKLIEAVERMFAG